jgi:peptidoglycan/LPS O-acetylase OafA/YrhL
MSDRDNPGGFSHLPELDGVRGLAILLVLLDHLIPVGDHTGVWLFDIFAGVRDCAWVGVYLFFALSGFLITGILVDTLNTRHFFKIFYVRRVLRIFPLYYGFLVALLLLTEILHFSWGGWQYFYLTYTANLAFWSSSPPQLSHFKISHLWSLQVEEQFYLVWPLIVYRMKNRLKLIRLCLIACLVAFLLRVVLVGTHASVAGTIFLPYSFTLCCCDNLFYGCALSLLLRTEWWSKIQRWAPLALMTCTLLIAAERIARHGAPWGRSFFMPTLGFSLVGIGSASLIAVTLVPKSFAHRILVTPIFRLLGRYSYGLYIFHYSVYGFLAGPLRIYFFRHLHSRVVSVFLSTVIVTSFSLVAAFISYHLYEIHFLRLKKYFKYHRASDKCQDLRKQVNAAS